MGRWEADVKRDRQGQPTGLVCGGCSERWALPPEPTLATLASWNAKHRDHYPVAARPVPTEVVS